MAEFTIDDLARTAGTTSRNVRAYQDRGLLPPPKLVGRTGYYDDGHLARLRHIAALLERGFTLNSIRELFEAWEQGYGLSDVIGFEEALAAPWDTEQSVTLTLAELVGVFGDDREALEQAIAIGLLTPEADSPDVYRVPSPRLLEAARRLTAAGIPMVVLLTEAGRLITDLDGVAERWVEVFKSYLWTDVELQMITEFLRGMPDMVGSIVAPLLAQAMERKVAGLAADTLGATPPPRRVPA
jgi:DNA-binding transcriptional MerR regulator